MKREKFGHKYDQAPFPFLWTTFRHKGKTSGPPAMAVLDSGATFVMIPKGLSDYLNLDTKDLDQPVTTAGGPRKAQIAKVDELEICRSNCVYFNNIDVYVIAEDMPILIGRKPFFEEYVVIIDEFHKMIECIRQDIYHAKKKK